MVFTGLHGFFNWGVFCHPVSRASARGLFIFIRCMVQHLQFLISLDSQPWSQIEYLSYRRVCCSSDSLRIPGMLAWRILSVLCPSFRRISLPQVFVVGGLLRLRRAFLGTLAWRVPGLLNILLWRACLEHIWRPLLFEVTSLLALLWRTCFTSDRLTRCIGRTS